MKTRIQDLDLDQLDYMTMKLAGADYMFGGQYKSYFAYGLSQPLIEEMRMQGSPLELIGTTSGWQCRFHGIDMQGASLLDAALRCYCAWKLGAAEVDMDFFRELYD